MSRHGAKKAVTGPLAMFEYLNELGRINGIGRMDMVENRFVGIKSRGIYESPGATILWAAHRDIEGIAMDKEVMHLKLTLEPKFSEYLYNGFWFAPEMDFLMAAFNQSQEAIDGKVTLSLYKGNVLAVARVSPTSLYNQELGSMDVAGGFDQTDSRGFIRLNSIRLKAHNVILDKKHIGLFREDTAGRLGAPVRPGLERRASQGRVRSPLVSAPAGEDLRHGRPGGRRVRVAEDAQDAEAAREAPHHLGPEHGGGLAELLPCADDVHRGLEGKGLGKVDDQATRLPGTSPDGLDQVPLHGRAGHEVGCLSLGGNALVVGRLVAGGEDFRRRRPSVPAPPGRARGRP